MSVELSSMLDQFDLFTMRKDKQVRTIRVPRGLHAA
jgi:hypothetical protein